MKTTPTSWAMAMLLVMLTPLLYAQESQTQMFIVHEDEIIMSELDNYRKAAETVKQAMVDHSITDAVYHTFSTNDNRFWYSSPLESYAALENDPFQSLAEKMGKDNMKAMFDKYEDTYTSHRNFVVHYHPDLSYKADELSAGNKNYREWLFQYIHLGKSDEYKEVLKEWQALYQKTEAKQGYTVYTGGIGMDEPVAIIMVWAETPGELEANFTADVEMQGGEREALWKKTRALLRKFETVDGWYHPELSYVPETEATAEAPQPEEEGN